MKNNYYKAHANFISLFSVFSILFNLELNSQLFQQSAPELGVNSFSDGLYGNGLSTYDWNKDGYDDIVLLSDSLAPAFYQNFNGQFEAIQFAGLEQILRARSVNWVDINNDLAPDLSFNTGGNGVKIFVNDGNFEFTNISDICGIDQTTAEGYGQSWGDYNHDGYLDVYISNYQTENEIPFRSNYLYKNNGNNTFTDVTEIAGLGTDAEMTFLSVWIDINLDTYPELYIINDRPDFRNYLYLNNTDGTFTDISESSGLGEYFNPMSGTVGDFDHDGDLDIYVTDDLNNRFYQNNGNNTFTNVAGIQGLQMNKSCWGAAWLDFENNGWEDLVVATADPAFSYNDLWYFSNNSGNFEVNQSVGFNNSFAESFSIATLDAENNGTVDLICHSKRPSGTKIYLNNNNPGNYFKLSLEGTVSNSDGIGTLVKVHTGNVIQTKYSMCGDQYLSQNSQWLHFGLGEYSTIDSLILIWPSGIIDKYFDIPVNQSKNYRETNGLMCSISIENKSNFCVGDTAILDAGEWDSYLWPDGSTDRYFAVTEAGEFVVSVTLGEESIMSSPIQISFTEPETANFQFENTPCFGSFLGMISSASNAAGNVETIYLNGIETTLPAEYLNAGLYQYNFIGSNGCMIEGNLEITEPSEILVELSLNIAGQSEECEGTISGYPIVSGGTPPYAIEWRFYLDNEIIPFQIIAEETFECVEFSSTINIQFRLSDANGCPIIVEEMMSPNVRPQITAEDKINVSPNPFEETFEILLNESATMSIFDLSGKLILTQKLDAGNSNIGAKNVDPGIYILNIQNSNLNLNTRILKL